MNKKVLLIASFVLMCLAQMYIPIKMILDKEEVLELGEVYKFETAPVDPNDPFKGKYIQLNFNANQAFVDDQMDWITNQEIFVLLEKDNRGFAQVKDVIQKRPTNSTVYVEAKVATVYSTDKSIIINYPFDRFYMEESKAKPAEDAFREAQRDSTQMAYALVSIKDGKSVLQDVIMRGISIQEIVESQGTNK